MKYDIIHMVRIHGEDGAGNDVPVMAVLKRLGRHRKRLEKERTKEMRNLKKFTVSLLTAATLITAFPFTAEAADGEPIGSFLKDRSGITVENEEAEELFQDFLEEISFTATDETWADILTAKGKNGLHERSYDNVFMIH